MLEKCRHVLMTHGDQLVEAGSRCVRMAEATASSAVELGVSTTMDLLHEISQRAVDAK
jgi:hypothetical protein